ncbi:class I SAM-dependent methyltransferase [Granulicella tundricola]|uniref:Methyltransferase type 12 n=1 Tax=Granulicella tundricola (strain ATCC BAA-1859 / DSM 23138 / MP5ACTX9) TaxID=1198114 RepID=E8X2A6_GRATM|nr:class I SAM-dependent methyltransferase [Granulicella tundricola]ADW68038.1 Methyltransferase type 12 [Granulicella tundricola MP5ACTX9]
MTNEPNFDLLARPYRWLEYLTLGPLLQKTRLHHLPALKDCIRALILGDGDGRFTAALLAQNLRLQADAVDLSPAMLALLRKRAQPFAARLTTHQQNVLTLTPTAAPDLVVTHFLLDCLTQPELDSLVLRLVPTLQPGALWLVSDFRIPPGLLHWPARLYIRALYLAFRVLTNLRPTQLPDFAQAFQSAGLHRIAQHHRLFGLLTTELWTQP